MIKEILKNMQRNQPTKTIWCGRQIETFFQISRVESKSWYIVIFGHEFWIGDKRPTFLNRGRFKKRVPEVG